MKLQHPVSLTRAWGEERVIVWTETHAGKLLTRKKGTKGGFQLHIKEESHYLHSGRLKLEYLRDGHLTEYVVDAGTAWTVQPGTVHREEALEDSLVFEVSDPTQNDRYAILPDPGGLPSMTDREAWEIAYDLRHALRKRASRVEDLGRRIGDEGLKGLAGPIPETVQP